MNWQAKHLQNLWPNSLFGRLALVWLLTLLFGHLAEVAASHVAKTRFEEGKIQYHLSKDTALLLHLLATTPASQRQQWMAAMQRQQYTFTLQEESSAATAPKLSSTSQAMVSALAKELGPRYPLRVLDSRQPEVAFAVQLYLPDRSPLLIKVLRVQTSVMWWGGIAFSLQALVLIGFTWIAVRQTTQPLQKLAQEAERLGNSLQCEPVAISGPREVVRAAHAFNAMQRRISEHLAERMHILASISHDLQTPITRMRLRADLMDNVELRGKLQQDLAAMQNLVAEGIAYARSAHSVAEEECRVDVDALLDSLVCDYHDAGHALALHGKLGQVMLTRPHALRRVVVNLLDNALKFGEQVSLTVQACSTAEMPKAVAIVVQDRGPGIPEEELEAVCKPFYRLEASRNRSSGGTGLGLAIAQQLVQGLQGRLRLSNVPQGGLQAEVILPIKGS